MDNQILSAVITAIGLLGFYLGGKKLWWAWYVNIGNQVLWAIFAIATGYYAFLVGTAAYFVVFSINAYKWTKEHFKQKHEALSAREKDNAYDDEEI